METKKFIILCCSTLSVAVYGLSASLQAQEGNYLTKSDIFEDSLYFYQWVTLKNPPMPDIRINGELFSWEEFYGPLPSFDPILRKWAKYPQNVKHIIPPEPDLIPVQLPVVESYSQTIEKLRLSAAAAKEREKKASQRLHAFAEEKEIPMTIRGGNGAPDATLIDITEAGEPIYISPCNIRGVATIGVNKLWPTNVISNVSWFTSGHSKFDLDGTSITIGMWEAPELNGAFMVQTNHQQFLKGDGTSRVTQYGTGSVSSHATSVAGVMVGYYQSNETLYSRGVCYNASLDAYPITSFSSNFRNATASGLQLANNSFEIRAGWIEKADAIFPWEWLGVGAALEDWKFGAYIGGECESGVTPRELDSEAYNSPHTLMVLPSGNAVGREPEGLVGDQHNGDQGGFDTLSPSACAKNVLTVGGIYAIPSGNIGTTNVQLAPFSSYGPTDDGRIKPEVVAAATCAQSTGYAGFLLPYYNATSPNQSAFTDGLEGTSLASAAVTGGLGLVMQKAYQLRPTWAVNISTNYPIRNSTLRALAVHTAIPATTNAGPSYKFGYGVFNALGAVNLLVADSSTNTKPFIKEVQVPGYTNLVNEPVQFTVKAANPSEPIKVTIAWTDLPGYTQTSNSVDETRKRLVCDLDLRVYPPGVTNYNRNSSSALKPFVLNPDLSGENPALRGAAATTGDDKRNNLEQVLIKNPTTNGEYTIRIERDIYNSSSEAQWVSIIISGIEIPEDDFEITDIHLRNDGCFDIKWNAVVGGIYALESSSTGNGESSWVADGALNAGLSAYKTQMVAQSFSTINNKQRFFRIKRLY